MAEWLEYGSPLDRLSGSSPTLAFAASGRLVVATTGNRWITAVADLALDCVDVASGRVVRAGPVAVIAVCDEHVVAAAADSHSVVVHRLPELALETTHDVDGVVACVDMDAATIAVGIGESLAIIDRAKTTQRRVKIGGAAERVRISPDGRRVAIATAAKTIAIVDLNDATVIATLKGPRSSITSMAWSPASDRIAASAGKNVHAWEISGKAPKAATLRKGKHDLVLVGCTTKGLVLSIGYKEQLAAIDIATGAEAWAIQHYGPAALHRDRIASMLFTALRELDANSGEVLRTVETGVFMHALAIHDGTIAAATRGSRVHFLPPDATAWPTPRGHGHDEDLNGACASGQRFATMGGDQRAIVWERGRSMLVFAMQPNEGSGATVHLDGDTLLTATNYGVQRWRVSDGAKLAKTEGLLKSEICLVLPLPAHRLVLAASKASRGSYGALYLLDAETLAIAHEVEKIDSTYARARILDGGRVELVGAYRRIVFDVASRAIVEDEHIKTEDYSRRPHLSFDAKVLVELDTRSRDETWYSLLRARAVAGAALYEPVELPEIIADADLSADDRLVTPHRDGLRIWNIRDGKQLAHLEPPVLPHGTCWCGDLLLCWDTTGALFAYA